MRHSSPTGDLDTYLQLWYTVITLIFQALTAVKDVFHKLLIIFKDNRVLQKSYLWILQRGF